MRFLCPALTAFVAFHALFPALAADLPTAITNDPTAFSSDLYEKFKAEQEGDFEDLAQLFEDPRQWRYYSRDGGTLIAISVSQNLVFTEQSAAKKSLAEIASRLIRQGGQETVFTVVFVEPSDLATHVTKPIRRLPPPIRVPISHCSCR